MKKAQVQFQESLFVLVIFVVLLLVALVAFFQFTAANIKADISNYEDSKFRSLIETIPAMSEFKCSELGQDIECIDLAKVKAFWDLNLDYTNSFGSKIISIEIIFPKEDKSYVIYENKPRNYKTVKKVSSFVSVYDLGQDKYKIGKLIVESFA